MEAAAASIATHSTTSPFIKRPAAQKNLFISACDYITAECVLQLKRGRRALFFCRYIILYIAI